MSVSRCLFVDWSSKIKHLNDSCRAEIKIPTNDLYQFIMTTIFFLLSFIAGVVNVFLPQVKEEEIPVESEVKE